MPGSLLIVEVDVHVKPECVARFISATEANAAGSRREPGVLRFDIIQRRDDPAAFVLVEVYRDDAAAVAHKETAHYAAWREAVDDLMAEPRSSRKFVNISPGDGEF
jgi:(4S)-4-hydroxy-5-phosphonooxypentane-2,3-dione isomerase